MLHIILMILKFLGILILVILGLIVLMVLSVLFVPISYRVKGKKIDEPPEGEAVVKWLFGLLWVKISYKDNTTDIDIRILGISLKKIRNLIHKRKKKKRVKAGCSAKSAIEKKQAERGSGEEKGEPASKPVSGTLEAEFHPKEESPSAWKKISRILQKVVSTISKVLKIPGRIINRLGEICLTFKNVCDKIKYWKDFLNEDTAKEAIRRIKRVSKRVICHVLPNKVTGYLKYGFDDPALTGQTLGALSLVTPLYRSRFSVIPVFEEKVFECDVCVKGRVFGAVLLKAAFDLYRSQAVKTTIKKFQRKEA